jgi:transposase-like protein
VGSRVVSEGVELLVSAVRDDGFREIVGVEVADTESEATYQDLFRSLKRRGLKGVELVVSDDHGGLKAAIARHFQGAAYQRCLLSTTRAIFSGWWVSASEGNWPRAGEHIEEHIEECLERAWLSQRATGGASAPPTAWRGSTRR